MAEFGPVQALCLENQGPMILAVSYVLLSLAIVAVGLRLYLRLGLRHGISSDDYVLVASCVSRQDPGFLGIITDIFLGRCMRRGWLLDKIRTGRHGTTYLLPVPGTNFASDHVEHHCTDIEHHWDRTCQDLSMPLCASNP